MNRLSDGRAWAFGLVGLLGGMLIGLGFRGLMMPPGYGAIGWVPFLVSLLGTVIWVVFWVLLIGGLLRGLGWVGGGRYYRRLEDLPADFDDWHRRAHERMRDGGAADDPGRRG